MKFKTSAIALAVAGTVATPMAAQADLYASARIGVEHLDTDDVADLRVRSFGSRFGVRSETDLGNGMTGFGRYEWDVDFTDHNEDTDDDIDVRHRYVGLKGDFGSVTIGQTYHTFYNHLVGPLDNPWWASGYNMVEYRGRTDHAVTYAGGTDNITFGVSVYLEREDDEDTPDDLEAAVSFGIGDMTLGVGIQTTETTHGSEETDDDIIGVTLSGVVLGPVTMGFGYQTQEDDSSIVADFGFGNAYLHVETLEDDSEDSDPLLVTLGYTQSLGRKTTMYYELFDRDADSGDSDDDATHIMAVLKYDII